MSLAFGATGKKVSFKLVKPAQTKVVYLCEKKQNKTKQNKNTLGISLGRPPWQMRHYMWKKIKKKQSISLLFIKSVNLDQIEGP